jgi:hypothetical protein
MRLWCICSLAFHDRAFGERDVKYVAPSILLLLFTDEMLLLTVYQDSSEIEGAAGK